MLLYLRRRTFGGELGGPRARLREVLCFAYLRIPWGVLKGRWQLASAAFLVFQWCVYIGASSAWVVLETE